MRFYPFSTTNASDWLLPDIAEAGEAYCLFVLFYRGILIKFAVPITLTGVDCGITA